MQLHFCLGYVPASQVARVCSHHSISGFEHTKQTPHINYVSFPRTKKSLFSMLCQVPHRHTHSCHTINNKIFALKNNKLISVPFCSLGLGRFKKLCDMMTELLRLLFTQWVSQATQIPVLNTLKTSFACCQRNNPN